MKTYSTIRIETKGALTQALEKPGPNEKKQDREATNTDAERGKVKG